MKRVLIVDDSAWVRSTLRSTFDRVEQICVCGEAIDGEDCIEKCKELDPDIVVLDLSMPRMNGAEAASILHRMNPKIRIVLYSLYSESIGSQLASAIGVDAVVSKYEDVTELIQLVAGWPG